MFEQLKRWSPQLLSLMRIAMGITFIEHGTQKLLSFPVPAPGMLAVPLLNLFTAILAAVLVIAILARFLPRTGLYRRFALMTSNPRGPSLADAPYKFATALALTPGTQGTAITVLRPSGKARFADHVVDVVTEGEFIASQTPVTVIQTDGMRVVVKSTP